MEREEEMRSEASERTARCDGLIAGKGITVQLLRLILALMRPRPFAAAPLCDLIPFGEPYFPLDLTH